jgi:hypothetical protein
MKYMLSAVAVLLMAFSAHSASAQVPAMTNADVTRLVAMRVSDQTMITVIHEAMTQFDLSDRAVGNLAVSEVSTAVIAAMRQPRTPTSRSVAPTTSPLGSSGGAACRSI